MPVRKVVVKKKAAKKATVKKLPVPVSRQAIPSPRDEASANVETAVKTGKWISIAIRVEGSTVNLNRTAVSFPKEDIDTVLRLIADDLNKLKVS